MDHDDTGINLGRIATLTVLATFSGLRRAVGIIGLVGLVMAGVLALQANQPVTVAVNSNPICNRVTYLSFEQKMDGGPRNWGQQIRTKESNVYVREANGTGYCLIKSDANPVIVPDPQYPGGLWKYKFYEVPSKYGERVQALAPPDNSRGIFAFFIGGLSVCILFGLWLPATIMAAVARRWMKNVQEEPL